MSDAEPDTPPPAWLGTKMCDMYRSQGPWYFSVPSVSPSKYHHVLCEFPVSLHAPPNPHYNSRPKHWDDDHVRMPYSPESLFVIQENDNEVIKPRWEVIKQALSEPINSSDDFERAVMCYNNRIPKFTALHHFLNNVLEEEEAQYFFVTLLPGIIELALQLPEILPGSLPLLKKNRCKSITMSQLQIASLLANAFLCTFIWRREMAQSYPAINFVRLFTAADRVKRQACVSEKLRSICHYFNRMIEKNPVGTVTFERKFLPRNQMPRWDSVDNNLGNTKIHISSSGMIEDAHGFLQVDFANKFVGGGVLGYGCVQEEIRFIICPELIVSRLFTEELGDNEALTITGVERYSNYSGYGDTFVWDGNVDDATPFDDFGRRRTSIAVIDATRFNRPKDQFHPSAILRELNKAYVGFSCREKTNIAPVASGNWGCGAFKGDPNLKLLVQLMACRAANRDLVYYSFGNETLRDEFYNMHIFLANNRVTIWQLWRYLCRFCAANLPSDQLYSYVQQSHFDSKTQPTLKQFFTPTGNKKTLKSPEKPAISPNNENRTKKTSTPAKSEKASPKVSPCKEKTLKDSVETTAASTSFQSFVVEGTPHKTKNTSRGMPQNSDEIISIIEMIDGNTSKSKDFNEGFNGESTLLSEIDKLRPSRLAVKSDEEVGQDEESPMEVDGDEALAVGTFLGDKKRRITDYFSKMSKSS